MKEFDLKNWNGYLPRRAIVMTASAKTSQNPVINQPAFQPVIGQPESELPPLEQPKPAPLTLAHQPARDQLAAQIAAELSGCTRCKLCQKRQNIVIGDGNLNAELVFVGEGPGEQEDIQGKPFVGNAGQLLDRMIQAIGLDRQKVYIANVVKCRPPGNRNPEPDEIQACSPFLYRQLDLIRPKVVVALGKFAAQTLLQTEVKITQMRGKFQPYRGALLMPTFHPSYLLRNPAAKREAWIDLQLVAKELGLEIPKRY